MEKLIINKPGSYKIALLLGKEKKELEWNGVIDAREKGEYDLDLVIKHETPDTFGRVTIRGIAQNGARIRVKGLVKIEKVAQNTDSFLSMAVLLLDKQSSATVEPELEILANRVKASHSASVGKIDEEQMLYLNSRGIPEQEAKNIIIKGFLN